MDVFEKLIAVVILAVALFIVPVLYLSTSSDSVTESVVYSITSDFTEDVKTQGKITQEMYMDFMRKLDSTGLLYDVEMKHCHFVVNPIFDTDGKTVTGTSTSEEIYYSDQILEKLFGGNDVYKDSSGKSMGIYTMNLNDTFTISVRNKENTMGQTVQQFVFNLPETPKAISVTCGGAIRDENY